MKRWGWKAAAAAALLVPAAAGAEIVEMVGLFPANNREASMLRSLAVERFQGMDGPALAAAIERRLSQPDDDGTVWFDLVGGRTGRATADGGLSGSVTTGVDETGFTRKDKKCVEKDDKGKCTKEEQVEVKCRRRIVNITVNLRLVRNSDGRLLYSVPKNQRDETSWCKDARPSRTVEEVVNSALGKIAEEVRFDIAPNVNRYRIALRESTKGMSKPDAQQFKALVKQSQRDLRGACQGWAAMKPGNPGSASIAFDLGLCAEQRGAFAEAQGLYQEAYRLIGGDGDEARVGLERIRKLVAGQEDAKERARRG